MENGTVRINVAFSEATWRALRRLAETERDPSGRASVTRTVNALVAEGLERRAQKPDQAGPA